ncbi:MAG TPA: glutathione S-transferase family protein [Usitatibacter sp.]|nr:glutathione S-transferase family protein [Usitatibacter sp.]
MNKPLLLGCKGCGNAIVESAFAVAGIPIDYEEVDYSAESPTRARLLSVNPLGQVPSLVLPDGRVMTESLAMIHHIDDHAPKAGLIPPPGDATRETFYRWAVFIVAALYPTFTYGDDPKKWVPDENGSKMLRESTNRHREAMWKQLESVAGSPWFLGGRMSALDLYFASMVYWRPGRKWFDDNAPKISAIAKKAAALDAVAPVIARNFS